MNQASELTSESKGQSVSIFQRYRAPVICGVLLGVGMTLSAAIASLEAVVALLFALFAGAIFPMVFLRNIAQTPWRRFACYVSAALLSSYWLLSVFVGGAASPLAPASVLILPFCISAISAFAVVADNKRKYRKLAET